MALTLVKPRLVYSEMSPRARAAYNLMRLSLDFRMRLRRLRQALRRAK